jgi:hypothetical protein
MFCSVAYVLKLWHSQKGCKMWFFGSGINLGDSAWNPERITNNHRHIDMKTNWLQTGVLSERSRHEGFKTLSAVSQNLCVCVCSHCMHKCAINFTKKVWHILHLMICIKPAAWKHM